MCPLVKCITMNLTLSINEQVLNKAREAAKAQGKSVNQLVREYLQQFSGQDDLQQSLAEFRATSCKGNSKGWKFNRDELYERT